MIWWGISQAGRQATQRERQHILWVLLDRRCICLCTLLPAVSSTTSTLPFSSIQTIHGTLAQGWKLRMVMFNIRKHCLGCGSTWLPICLPFFNIFTECLKNNFSNWEFLISFWELSSLLVYFACSHNIWWWSLYGYFYTHKALALCVFFTFLFLFVFWRTPAGRFSEPKAALFLFFHYDFCTYGNSTRRGVHISLVTYIIICPFKNVEL